MPHQDEKQHSNIYLVCSIAVGLACVERDVLLVAGKSKLAVQIAKLYGAALLNVDAVVLEAIANGNTPAGLKARELCAEAAHRRAEEVRAQLGESGEVFTDGKKATGGRAITQFHRYQRLFARATL